MARSASHCFCRPGQFVAGALALGVELVAPRRMIGARRHLALDDLQLGVDQADAALAIVDRRRDGVLAHRHAGTGGVDQADRLVRQLAGGDVASRQAHGLAHRFIEDAHLVMQLERGDEAANHGDRHLFARLLDLHRLEATGEGGVLLEILLVFGPGGGGDRAQLAAGEGRLQQIGGIVLAGLAAGADQRMGLVDEQDDRLGAGLGLVDHRLQAVLEFALHARAGLQQAEIERAQGHVAQRRRHVARRDAQRKALDDRGLADARFAGEDRIVLPTARQDVDHLPDLEVAAEDRIDLAGLGLRRQVDRELIEGRRSARPGLARPGAGRFGADRLARRLRRLRRVGADRQVVALERVGRNLGELTPRSRAHGAPACRRRATPRADGPSARGSRPARRRRAARPASPSRRYRAKAQVRARCRSSSGRATG